MKRLLILILILKKMKPFKFLKSIFGNTILLVSVYLMSPGLSYAQTYHPIIDTNKYWMVKITGSNYPCCPYSILETFYFSGDTLINNLTYKKLMKNNIKLSDTTLKKTTIYAGSLREDTAIRKIYFIYPNNVNTLEKIIYDFFLNIGDSVTFFYTGRGVQKGIIDSIDFVKINNVCTKRYFIKEGINSEGWMDIWIEGIGSLFGLVYPGMRGIDFGPYFGLSLAKQNQDTIFQSTDIIQCCTGINEHPFKEINIDLYPNPFTSHIILRIESQLKNYDVELSIYNTHGMLVKRVKHIQRSEIKIDASRLSDGIYYYKLKNNGVIFNTGKLIKCNTK